MKSNQVLTIVVISREGASAKNMQKYESAKLTRDGLSTSVIGKN